MAAKAFILVSVEPVQTQPVGERLRAIRGALVYEVMGPYDYILDVEADTPEDLANVLRTKVRPIAGVKGTLTCAVLASEGTSG